MAAFKLKCPHCEQKFIYDVSEGWPDFCPKCAHKMGNDRADDDIVMPAFLSQKSKNNDKVARDIMDGSEKRAELAAEMAGVPVSEMSSLKVTDLNDRNDAQFSAKEVVNPVTQQMDKIKAMGGQVGFGATQASEFAASAHTGAEPNAGLRARNRIQNILQPIGQAPLPLEISNNPNYRQRA
jgi:hypothetical protein